MCNSVCTAPFKLLLRHPSARPLFTPAKLLPLQFAGKPALPLDSLLLLLLLVLLIQQMPLQPIYALKWTVELRPVAALVPAKASKPAPPIMLVPLAANAVVSVAAKAAALMASKAVTSVATKAVASVVVKAMPSVAPKAVALVVAKAVALV